MSEDGRNQAEWDRYFESHHKHQGLGDDHPLRRVEFDANHGRFLPPPPARILDLGFGGGWTLRLLAALGYSDLHGWDISADCIENARAAKVPGALRHVDGVQELSICDPGCFDAIIAKDLLEHLSRDQVLPFIAGLRHALAPGGVFLARLPNMANPLATQLRYDDFTHRLGFTEHSIRQVFELGGFARDDVRVENDRLPGLALLRHGLILHFLREKLSGPITRGLLFSALESQRKGRPKVRTLRMIVVARRGAAP